jgi:cytoskeletal protein CcmA (bactofilin family)
MPVLLASEPQSKHNTQASAASAILNLQQGQSLLIIIQQRQAWRDAIVAAVSTKTYGRKDKAVSTHAIARTAERPQRVDPPKDNWLGFVGDVLKFTGKVQFRSMLRIDGNFSGQVDSADGTLIISAGAQVSKAVINVAVAKINGTVEGVINASKELILGPTANVSGRVSATMLTVEDGALFNGSFHNI